MDNTKPSDESQAIERKLEIEERKLEIEEQKLELKKTAIETTERLAILTLVGLFVQANMESELIEKMTIALGVWLASLGFRWRREK